MTGYAFSKTKFEEDFYSWGNEEEKAEYKEDIKDPCFWVNALDGAMVDADNWTIPNANNPHSPYVIDKNWCEFRKEN